MFGGLDHHVRSHRVNEWVHPEDSPKVWKYYNELVSGERDDYRVEKAFYRNDGTVLWTNLTVSLLRDAEGNPEYQLALMEDTTERRLLNLRLRYEATHDALTGLPNRTLFSSASRKRSRPVTAAVSGSATWTWTASRRSTTAWATPRATGCSSRSRTGCRAARPRRARWWRGSAATSSWR